MSDNETLKQKTARGILWSALGNAMMQILNLLFGIVLARLLSTADYGMVGVLTVFTALAGSLQEGGLIAAMANKREARPEDYNAVFWFSLLVSLALYAVLFLCAPLIAAYYREPRLTALARYVFLGFVVSSLSCAPLAYLYRNLQVKQRSVGTALALLFSGSLGILMAWQGMAYWGMATQNLAYISFTCLYYWRKTPWRPTWRGGIDFRPLRPLLAFGSKLMLTNLLNTLNNNFFPLLLGRIYRMSDVGLFTQAFKWNTMGYATLSGMINNVAQPVLVKVQDEADRSLRVFRKMLRFAAFVSFPCMGGLALAAPEFIELTVGPKWAGSVPMLRLLCAGGAFAPLSILYGNLANSAGRSDLYMRNTVGLALCQIFAALALCPLGIRAMLTGYSALTAGWVFVWHFTAGRLVGLRLADALRDAGSYLLTALLALGAAWGAAACCTGWHPAALLGVKVAVAAAVYCLLLWTTDSAIFRESLQTLFKKKPHP